MSTWLQDMLAWTQAHPEWALGLIFMLGFVDCLFIIGLFVIFAAAALFGIGALVALGAIEFWPAILSAAAGAVLGDTISYLIGRHYGVALFRSAFFVRRPNLVERGRAFFGKHGGKGLIVAHNLGVLRPLLPAMAGAYGLTPARYAIAIIPAALSWALIYIVPGVAFGASMGLAAEVTRRLAILIVGLGGLLWLTLWLTWFVVRKTQGRAEAWLGAMLDLSRRNRTLGKLGPALADPDQPETPVLTLLSLLLLTLGSAALLLIWGITPRESPPGADLAVYQALRSLEEPWATAIAVFFALLGEWQVYLPYAIAVLVALAWMRSRRAAAHWLAALLFGIAITLGLSLVPNISNPLEYRGLVDSAHFPRDLVMAAVIYGFTPVLLGGTPRRRMVYYGATMGLLLLIALSRLYLGTLWLSVGLVALLTGLLWVAALGLGYRRHTPEKLQDAHFAPALAVLALAAGWHVQAHFDLRELEHAPAPAAKTMDAESWWTQNWQKLPSRRQDMAGRDKQFLNLQWAGDVGEIQAALLKTGWEKPQELSFATALRWLSSSAPVSELPLLPRFHAGHHQALTLRRPIDDDRQYLLRLWPSGYVLANGQPLWIGTLVLQQARPVFRLFRYPLNENIYTQALDALNLPLAGYESRRTQRETASFVTLLLRPAGATPNQ